MLNSEVSYQYCSDGSITSPREYRLYQNFPQSFYRITNIGFDLPEDTKVTLAIYDVYGRDILILLNQELLSGSYEVKWNTYKLEPGIYFYKLKAGDYVDSKKMFLLKN